MSSMPNHFLTGISVQSSMCSKFLVLLALLKPRRCVFLWGEGADYYIESLVFMVIITITGWLMPNYEWKRKGIGKGHFYSDHALLLRYLETVFSAVTKQWVVPCGWVGALGLGIMSGQADLLLVRSRPWGLPVLTLTSVCTACSSWHPRLECC